MVSAGVLAEIGLILARHVTSVSGQYSKYNPKKLKIL
jgi:hypothetical protein